MPSWARYWGCLRSRHSHPSLHVHVQYSVAQPEPAAGRRQNQTRLCKKQQVDWSPAMQVLAPGHARPACCALPPRSLRPHQSRCRCLHKKGMASTPRTRGVAL